MLDTRGDGLARPLPELLRVRPQRFLYTAPPSGVPVGEIVRDLRNFLDGPGFEWLCALAVYPAVQWDLTLFLGVSLPEQRGGDVARAPLYREDRIAALTQLPWLREGIMPNWLRTALIGELDQSRQAEIREILQRLIDSAQLSGDVRRDDAVKLRISQEAAKDRVSPDQLMQDEVLLDFLARGKIEDFALPNASWLERFLPRGWLDRIGIPELAAGIVALAYAAAVFWLTPKHADGALVTGAWLPLITLLAGAIFALVIAEPAAAYRTVRHASIRAAPTALAFAIIAALAWSIGSSWGRISSNPIGLAILMLPAAVLVLWHARWVAGWLGMSVYANGHSRLYRWSNDLAKAILLILSAALTLQVAEGIINSSRSGDGFFLLPSAVAGAGLAVFVLGMVFSRHLPERLPPPKPVPRAERASRLRGGMRAAFTLLPILPAAWLSAYVGNASIKLDPIPGGATVVAELPGGTLIALGGDDGIVRIYDTIGGAVRPLTPISAGAPISGLALRADRDGDASSPVALAVSTADGRVLLFDAKGGSPRQMPATFANLRGEGSKVHVALGPRAQPVAGMETAQGEARLVSGSGATSIAEAGPVIALTATNGASAAIATLDGQVRLAELGAAAPRISIIGGDVWRLPGSARTLRYDAVGPSLTLLGDDGTIISARLSDSGLAENTTQRRKDDRLRLGEASQWRAQNTVRTRATDQPTLHILSIGVDRYPNLGDAQSTRFAAADARSAAEILRSTMGRTFARVESRVLLDSDATKNNILEGLADIAASTTVNDSTVVFLSGRSMNQGTEFYFVPFDASSSSGTPGPSTPPLPASLISGKQLLDALASARGRRMIIADGHGSRSFVNSAVQEGIAVALGTAVEGTAQELPNEGHGAFTAALLQGLSGTADANADGRINTAELSAYVSRRVRELTRGQQEPFFASPSNFDFLGPTSTPPTTPQPTSPGTLIRDCPTCPEMIVVTPGSFMMGSPASEEGRFGDEDPQHRVTISRPVAVGRFAITFDEWDACVAGGGCNGHKPNDEGWGRGRLPVINVSWDDAKAYAAWLSRTTGQTYRLLTEAEREYVTRAGTTTPFWWGATISARQANYDAREVYGKDGEKGEYRQRTVPVDSFEQNPWGLFNVHGNVWEWTEDCWVDNYNGAPVDGSARPGTTGACTSRVVRGGSWFLDPRDLRSAVRDRNTPDSRNNGLGFRLARTITK